MSSSPALGTLAEGQVLAGKFRILSLLGEGGMGLVFAATHLDLERTVAIKIIRQDLVQFSDIVARLMAEARAAARIHSEHVCRVLDVGRLESGAPYIVMEHLEGADLGRLIAANGPMAEPAAIDLLLEACEAVAEAHAARIIHRDLKPENLFLARLPDGRDSIKVLDFGISKLVGESSRQRSLVLTTPSSALGSPYFMAPEQMHDARSVDQRADIWALGAILYHLLTGKMPFDGDTITAVCAAVLQATPAPVRSLSPHVSSGVELAIERCLSKDRAARFASVAELAQAIAPFGSARASISVERIASLLGSVNRAAERTDVLWSSTPPGVSARDESVSSNVTKRAKLDPSDVRALAASTGSSSVHAPRHGARWVLAITAALTVVVGIALLGGRPKGSAATSVTAAASPASAPAVTWAKPDPRPTLAAPPALAEPISSYAPSAAAAVTPEVERPRRQPIARPVAPGSVRPKPSSAVNPWNPDTFGGRR